MQKSNRLGAVRLGVLMSVLCACFAFVTAGYAAPLEGWDQVTGGEQDLFRLPWQRKDPDLLLREVGRMSILGVKRDLVVPAGTVKILWQRQQRRTRTYFVNALGTVTENPDDPKPLSFDQTQTYCKAVIPKNALERSGLLKAGDDYLTSLVEVTPEGTTVLSVVNANRGAEPNLDCSLDTQKTVSARKIKERGEWPVTPQSVEIEAIECTRWSRWDRSIPELTVDEFNFVMDFVLEYRDDFCNRCGEVLWSNDKKLKKATSRPEAGCLQWPQTGGPSLPEGSLH